MLSIRQLLVSEGFGKEVVATCFQGSLLVVLVGIGCKGDDGAVSYTHLDVYKRQE